MQEAASAAGITWPLPPTKQQAFDAFAQQAAIEGVTNIRESGCVSVVPCMQEEIFLAP